MPNDVLFVKESDRLIQITKEWNARSNVYLIKDRTREYLILTQRMPSATRFINSDVVSDRRDRVNSTSLYSIAGTETEHKLRWTVQVFDLATGVSAFEKERCNRYDHVLIVGSPLRYKLELERSAAAQVKSLLKRCSSQERSPSSVAFLELN